MDNSNSSRKQEYVYLKANISKVNKIDFTVGGDLDFSTAKTKDKKGSNVQKIGVKESIMTVTAGIEIYNKSISIWPKNDRAKKGLAGAYIMVGDIPQAVKTYGEIVQANIADWQGWAGLANAQAQSGQLDVALEAYIRSLEINVYNAPAHLGIGNILFKMKNDVLAEKHLAKAVELDPAMTEAYIYLAAIKVRGQDFKGAALLLNRGLILDPAHEIGNMMKRELSQLD